MKEINGWEKGKKVYWNIAREIEKIMFDGEILSITFRDEGNRVHKVQIKCTQFSIDVSK